MQFYRRLEAILNVAPTGHFTLNSRKVLGNIIERVDLELGGTALTKAMITNLAALLNGKTTFGPISASQLDIQERYLNLVNDAARLSIDFTEIISRSVQGQLMGALDTEAAGITEFVLEGDITGATAPTLVAYGQLRSPSSVTAERGFDPRTRPLIRGLIRSTPTATAANEAQFDLNYGSKGNSLIKRVWIHSTILTAFRVRRDSIDLYGENAPITAAQAEFIAERHGRQWQPNMYVWDPLMDGNQPDAVPTRIVLPDGRTREANFEWLFTQSGAGQHTVYTDVYSLLDDL